MTALLCGLLGLLCGLLLGRLTRRRRPTLVLDLPASRKSLRVAGQREQAGVRR